jgi:hypothetical protein
MIMYSHFYLRNGTVYVPTMGMMEKGFYRGIEPVAVVSVTNTDALREALAAAIARGNPVVPKLRRREWPPPVVLKYAGVKSWSAFERGMMLWSIEEKDGVRKIVGTRKGSDGAMVDDPAQTVSFPPGTPVQDVVNRMIAILQEAAQK